MIVQYDGSTKWVAVRSTAEKSVILMLAKSKTTIG